MFPFQIQDLYVLYEFNRQKDLKRKATTGFNNKIVYFLTECLAYGMFFAFVKTGLNPKYNFFIYTFELQFPKWVCLIATMLAILFS